MTLIVGGRNAFIIIQCNQKGKQLQINMSNVKLKNENIYGWDGYRLEVGDISLGITPQIGGRIISLTHKEEELFFVQDNYKGETYDFSKVSDLTLEKRKMGFRLWGGDKTWVAPEKLWLEKIPPLELDAGQYEARIHNNYIEMISPICRETGLQITRQVELKEDGTIVINQFFRNMANHDIERGIWNVTQCLKPFDVYLPASSGKIRAYEDQGLIENIGGKKEICGEWIKIKCADETHFKFGGFIDFGKVVALRTYQVHSEEEDVETLAFIRSFDLDFNADYAHDAIAEVYNSPKYNYLEIEVHAPLRMLKEGDELFHQQVWHIGRLKGKVSPKEALDVLTKT